MRCGPRPGSYFCSLDCRRFSGECWVPLYDLITSPLRRGRSVRPRSGICHVLVPTPIPRGLSPRVARFSSLLRVGGPIHHLDDSASTLLTSPFFSCFHTSRKLPHPIPETVHAIKWQRGQPTLPTWICLRLQRALRPRTERGGKADPGFVTWLSPPTKNYLNIDFLSHTSEGRNSRTCSRN